MARAPADGYRDGKRAWWLLSAVYPLLPLLGVAGHAATGRPILLGLPVVVAYGLMPLLDALVGEDPNSPPEEAVPRLEADRYYRRLTWAAVPMHGAALLGCAWWAGTRPLAPWALLLLAYVAGLGSGLGINTGHELGHRRERGEQWLARLVLAFSGYGHFTIEHGRGHHRQVATPDDPASARMGESIYRFALREIPGGLCRAVRLERERLRREGRGFWSPSNAILQSWSLTLAMHGALVATFGAALVPFLLVHDLAAWWQLTSANYVEHYGLLRARLADGSWEPPRPHHSWNANHLATNLVLFHLQRHSDHHADASRRYQSLRAYPEAPQLPSGYFGMFPVAYLPWLWFRVMDRRLLALPHVAGDLSRVNRAEAATA